MKLNLDDPSTQEFIINAHRASAVLREKGIAGFPAAVELVGSAAATGMLVLFLWQVQAPRGAAVKPPEVEIIREVDTLLASAQ